MPDTSICVLIPSIGRPTLGRLLASVREQDLLPGDEVLLVSDDRHGDVARVWAGAGLPGRHVALEGGPYRDWGHTPRNRTLPLVRTGYVTHADDDDVLLPGALARVRGALRAHPGAFHVFPFVHHADGHLVGTARVLAHGHVGTPNLVHPVGIPLGRWGEMHGGDGAFICETVALNPDREVHWHPSPHYFAHPPADLPLADCYAAGYRVARAHVPGLRLVPAKADWVDLAGHGGGAGREDCQAGWHELAAGLFAGADVLDVGAGLGFSRLRLAPAAGRLRLQDPGPGLPVDLSCPVAELPKGDAGVVTAFDVLEHVEDDLGFVGALVRAATRFVFLTTPNWNVSRAANPHHCREYTPAQLLALVEDLPVAGLWIGDSSGWNARVVDRTEFTGHAEPHQAVLLRCPETSRLGTTGSW
ncbi:hypothetical protein VT84_07220 [Gemmata sp. SH-PL17]|uniref:glycosyltransferase n=1 Tax=Gemmata sp. SH-PL17 TaxID=1630693 RepID=UPI00078EF327|nr:glycosyltransferase [Gemmata sp. SH-PL17]AMV24170.1 hypothetical protein VT84_07220 [Gemmata sp. SH-PL17]